MIDIVLKIYDSAIKELAWTERFGGLVKPIVIEEPLYEGGVTRKRFPISCDTTARQCYENERYLDLVPDEKFKSVSYWEQVGDTRIRPLRDVRNKWEFTASVDFVTWLNLPKLGFEGCNDVSKFVGDAFRAIMQVKDNRITSPFRIDKISIEPILQTQHGESVFQQYSYEDKRQLMLYPYGAFAIRFEVKWLAAMDCFLPVELLDPIDCQFPGSNPNVPFNCPPVQIFDGNGVLIAEVQSGGSYTFEEASTIQLLINGQLWDNLIANEDVPVVNTDGDPLGSKVGNEWVIDDTLIELFTDGDLQFSGFVPTKGTSTINIDLV
jgi:hypothetical protein